MENDGLIWAGDIRGHSGFLAAETESLSAEIQSVPISSLVYHGFEVRVLKTDTFNAEFMVTRIQSKT